MSTPEVIEHFESSSILCSNIINGNGKSENLDNIHKNVYDVTTSDSSGLTSEKVAVSMVAKNEVQTERKAKKTLANVRNVSRIWSKNEITFKIWNIHGLKSSTINAIKNKSDSFLNNVFNNSDFIIFTET